MPRTSAKSRMRGFCVEHRPAMSTRPACPASRPALCARSPPRHLQLAPAPFRTAAPRSSAAIATACPIGPAPSTSTRSPAATRPRTTVRTAIDMGSMKAVSRASVPVDRERLGGGNRESLLQCAVAVDADQRDALAGVAAPEQARHGRCRTRSRARRRRAGRRQARRAVWPDVLDDRRELVPLDARVELVVARPSPGRRGSNGSRCRRGRSPRVARRRIRAPPARARGRRRPPSSTSLA